MKDTKWVIRRWKVRRNIRTGTLKKREEESKTVFEYVRTGSRVTELAPSRLAPPDGQTFNWQLNICYGLMNSGPSNVSSLSFDPLVSVATDPYQHPEQIVIVENSKFIVVLITDCPYSAEATETRLRINSHRQSVYREDIRLWHSPVLEKYTIQSCCIICWSHLTQNIMGELNKPQISRRYFKRR